MLRSVPLPRLCQCLIAKKDWRAEDSSLFQCFPVLAANKSPATRVCRVAIVVLLRPQRTGYFLSVEQPFTYLKFVVVLVSVLTPFLIKVLFIFL